ncbi:xylose isomerase domain-containing protein [Halosimplex carlsbadense 2-9-1]|uniref:Xylose isomerase domain-containing protein n=1 Tax=Halosimplex carlsbadense 2-9-1 TaxID=797114 RepID=M0CNY1_9EURY|nr:sugar phosphate isomerase/epimerase family protein [Halosimplex carlsbadense]ELZ24097.1 xylose isomerase domain-containing protein [Halosimplex carlsbadense 2-9-1]
MRLGGPVFADYDGPAEWIAALDDLGYGAAYCPVDPDADPETVRAYREAAADADVTIAEVGAWGVNPVGPDPDEREAAIAHCARHLELADAVGANCAVNVAGSRGDSWAGPHPDNFDAATFDLVVDSVSEIIDRADPDSASYTLEAMPAMVPDSVESYRRLLDAVDRDAFAVHFDPVNLVASPRRYADTAALIERFVEAFGDLIQCVHLKDVAMGDDPLVHLSEVAPGEGDLDYRALLEALDGLDDDLPVMLEHLDSAQAYDRAADHVRSVADEVGVSV